MGQINAVMCPETGKSQDYRHLIKGPDKPKWTKAMTNEIERLFQVIQGIVGTDTCFFIHKHEVPQDIKVTYSRIVCNIIPQKTKTYSARRLENPKITGT